MTPRLLAYARTSTDDNQSPEDSLAWQLAAARQLAAGRAEIVTVVHDIDVSRALPWARRPQAAALLTALPDPDRGWDGIIVGEPQRAFGSAAQVQLVLAQLNHWNVTLWVPELGGPVDPESEAHDILLSMFGGLSRAERNRLRSRVRTAMRAMSGTGRWLGGRPPYGYRLVPSETPHPNPEKARHGIMLSRLEVDPDTAPVVEQIFQWRIEGLGYRAIANRLDQAGIPSPSAADPDRNPHRPRSSWSLGGLRALIANPRYKGTDRYGNYRKVEELLDPHDPAAGHVTRFRRNADSDVLTHDGAVPAIVAANVWEQAQPTAQTLKRGPRPDRKGPTNRYAFRGLLSCGICRRKMQGNTVRRKSGTQRIMYRCCFREDYPNGQHPKSISVAEARVLDVVDEWLAELTNPDQLDTTVDQILANHRQPAGHQENPIAEARKQASEARQRLDRLYELMEDPDYPVERARPKITEARAELDAAERVIAQASAPTMPTVTRTSLIELFKDLDGLAGLLDVATPEERHELYTEAGLALSYHRREDGTELVKAALHAPNLGGRGELSRVGGGT